MLQGGGGGDDSATILLGFRIVVVVIYLTCPPAPVDTHHRAPTTTPFECKMFYIAHFCLLQIIAHCDCGDPESNPESRVSKQTTWDTLVYNSRHDKDTRYQRNTQGHTFIELSVYHITAAEDWMEQQSGRVGWELNLSNIITDQSRLGLVFSVFWIKTQLRRHNGSDADDDTHSASQQRSPFYHNGTLAPQERRILCWFDIIHSLSGTLGVDTHNCWPPYCWVVASQEAQTAHPERGNYIKAPATAFYFLLPKGFCDSKQPFTLHGISSTEHYRRSSCRSPHPHDKAGTNYYLVDISIGSGTYFLNELITILRITPRNLRADRESTIARHSPGH